MPRGGKRPGAGRKPRAQESEIRAALHAAIAPADVHAKLADKVRAGESWAITLYMAYDWGKPRESVEVAGEGGGPVVMVVKKLGNVSADDL